MRKLRLVKDWRQAWKWLSVQAMLISSAILSTWALLPEDMKARLPHDIGLWAAIVTLGAGVVGRVIDQNKPADGADT
jgi:hypothetical protein